MLGASLVNHIGDCSGRGTGIASSLRQAKRMLAIENVTSAVNSYIDRGSLSAQALGEDDRPSR
jgi:hypothetical protein